MNSPRKGKSASTFTKKIASKKPLPRQAIAVAARPTALQKNALLQAQNAQLRTDQGEIEQALRRYTSLYDCAPIGYATLDEKGRINQINLAGAALLGRDRHQLEHIGFSGLLAHKKDRELFADYLQRCRLSKDPEKMITTEVQLRGRSGQGKLVQLTTRPAEGALKGSFLVAITDITRTREAEAALRGSEEMLAAVLGAAMDAIISVDEDQHIVFFNVAAEHMFRRSSAEVIGQPLSLLIAGRSHAGSDRQLPLLSQSGALGELKGVRADGGEFPIEASISQTITGSDKFFTVILRDISERKTSEAEKLFLLQLNEHIRMATDAGEMQAWVMAAVARQLHLARCFLARVDTAKDQFILEGGCHAEGMPVMTDGHLTSAFSPRVVDDVLAGRIITVADIAADPRTADHLQNYQSLKIGACVVVPLMHEGRPLAAMVMTAAGSHAWSESEVSLFSTVAERLWLALEKLRLNEELRESAARFRTMAERVPVFMFTTNAAGQSDYMNQQFLDYTGLTAQASGVDWMKALHADDHAAATMNWQSAVADRKPFEMSFRLRAADGSFRWFRSTAHPVHDEHGNVIKWFGSCADIDDLMRTQAELAAVNEKLEVRVMERTAQLASANKELRHEFKERQRLEHEITEISERERRSLGQALHDGVCQHLSGVGMMAATLSDVCERKSDPETADKLKEIASLIRSATNDARDVARGLHPVDVDANGLVAALRDLTARYDMPGQTRCVLNCHEPVPVHDNDAAMHLYRIVQEAVVNASKHAHARNISVHLGIRQRDIMLSITDDGVGLPSDHDQAPGLGLKLMRYRASSIGATFTISPRPAGGTVVRCSLPAPA